MLANTRVTPPKLSRKAALAWASGFVDGDGCLHIAKQTFQSAARKNRPCYRPRVTVSQADYGTLVRVNLLLGGKGCLCAGTQTAQNNRQPYNLTFDGKAAMDAVRALMPALYAKRAQALVMLSYERRCKPYARSGPKGHPASLWALRERYYRKLQRMK